MSAGVSKGSASSALPEKSTGSFATTSEEKAKDEKIVIVGKIPITIHVGTSRPSLEKKRVHKQVSHLWVTVPDQRPKQALHAHAPYSELQAAVAAQMSQRRGETSRQKSVVAEQAPRIEDISPLALHQMVLDGIATKDLVKMLDRFDAIPRRDLLAAIGVSERTLQRRSGGRMSREVATVALDLAAITEQAESVLGSMKEAQRWLTTGAVALDGERPIDLLCTRQGADLVRDALVRMEHGVYA